MPCVVLYIVVVVLQRIVLQARPPVEWGPSPNGVKQWQIQVFQELVAHPIALWSLVWQGPWLPAIVVSRGTHWCWSVVSHAFSLCH